MFLSRRFGRPTRKRGPPLPQGILPRSLSREGGRFHLQSAIATKRTADRCRSAVRPVGRNDGGPHGPGAVSPSRRAENRLAPYLRHVPLAVSMLVERGGPLGRGEPPRLAEDLDRGSAVDNHRVGEPRGFEGTGQAPPVGGGNVDVTQDVVLQEAAGGGGGRRLAGGRVHARRGPVQTV